MPNPVVHWEIQTKNPEKIQKFFAELFDWHVDASNPMNYGFVDSHTEDGINGGIGAAQGGANQVTVYVQVDDLESYLKKAESLGGKTVMPVTEIPGVVTLAMFSDPEGNVIGMVKE
jgi:predicted enzyme related to lactoylglutathione lyase